MAQTNIFATRTGDHSRPRHVILHVVRDPRASASTIWQAMGRRTCESLCALADGQQQLVLVAARLLRGKIQMPKFYRKL